MQGIVGLQARHGVALGGVTQGDVIVGLVRMSVGEHVGLVRMTGGPVVTTESVPL